MEEKKKMKEELPEWLDCICQFHERWTASTTGLFGSGLQRCEITTWQAVRKTKKDQNQEREREKRKERKKGKRKEERRRRKERRKKKNEEERTKKKERRRKDLLPCLHRRDRWCHKPILQDSEKAQEGSRVGAGIASHSDSEHAQCQVQQPGKQQKKELERKRRKRKEQE